MNITTNPPTPARMSRPVLNLAKRLGVQAVMSVTVMAGLQLASINGYDVRDLLPARAPEARGPVEPPRIAAAPAGLDVPAQLNVPAETSDAVGPIRPEPAAREVADVSPRDDASEPARPTPLTAAVPSAERIAIPTPRPRIAEAPPAAVPPAASEATFDAGSRGVDVYGITELAAEETPPMPEAMPDAGFRVGDLVPASQAILVRTADLTGSAAHAVTGTASRILDLVR